MTSAIKSTLALGNLLLDGIGNTIRISVNGAPQKEIPIVKELLKSCNPIQCAIHPLSDMWSYTMGYGTSR